MSSYSRVVVSVLVCSLLVSLALSNLGAQEADREGLLRSRTVAAIADEVSGAQAYGHILDMVGYERPRGADEFGSGTFREALYMAAKAREYGLSDVTIERVPQARKEWAGQAAELWIEQPETARRLVTRLRDIPLTLAEGSQTSDVTAELVYVGRGDRELDYAGKDVAGKIVLGSGGIDGLHNLAVRKFRAAGVATFNDSTGKTLDRPDQIMWGVLSGVPPDAEARGLQKKTTFGFQLSHRMGMELIGLLQAHPKVVVRAMVKATEYPLDWPVVIATIPGDGSVSAADKPEVVFVGHLFEGATKQGANDNASGPAVELEIARSWIELIARGALPRPKRTIRFVWMCETTGTRGYLTKHPEVIPRALAVINMDMVGGDLTKNKSSVRLITTPQSLPSFLNDVVADVFDYVGRTNREPMTHHAFQRPIIDPRGSRDPFAYHIEPYSGGSDHMFYLNATPRVPAVQLANWPDAGYHTSDDSPEFVDPTELKRIAFIGMASGVVLAGATPSDGLVIASLTAALGHRRLADDLLTAQTRLTQANDERELSDAFNEGLNLVHWAYQRETLQVRSAAVLVGADKTALAELAGIEAAVAAGEFADAGRVEAVYRSRCLALVLKPQPRRGPTTEEQEATRLVPRMKPLQLNDDVWWAKVDPVAGKLLPGSYATEARFFADGMRSLLDVRNALSGELGPIGLDKVVAFFRELEREGLWTIETRAR